MKKLFLAAATVVLAGGSASAADMPVKAVYKAPPAYAHSWTGCFIGANGGGVWVSKDYTLASPLLAATGAALAGTAEGSHTASSGIGGFQIGCDYQFAGGWVIGIQGDYDWTRARGTHVDPLIAAGVTELSNTTSLGSVTGRLGYAWDRFLGYVRGGVAWERDGYLAYTTATGIGAGIASQNRSGWTIGVGGEYAFTNCISAFLEYDYYDFGTQTANLIDGGSTPYLNTDVRERKSVVKAGLNFRFGGGPVVANY